MGLLGILSPWVDLSMMIKIVHSSMSPMAVRTGGVREEEESAMVAIIAIGAPRCPRWAPLRRGVPVGDAARTFVVSG